MRQRYAVAAVGCSILALLSAASVYLCGQISDHGLGLADALLWQSLVWIAWVAVAPWVSRWGGRFRVGWPPSGAAVMAIVAGVAATIAFFALVNTATSRFFEPAVADVSAWTYFRNQLVYTSPLATITFAATLGAGYASEYARRRRDVERLEAQLTRAQLSALRMQLSPHFLFNALHTIGILVRERDERSAVEMLERLGDVLRHVLHVNDEPEVRLGEEVEFLRTYLEIEQARFGDRLRVSFDLEDGCDAALVPQLIVQPLAENALRHGLAGRSEPGHLAISARRCESELEVSVGDDGAGLPSGGGASGGLGLANVRGRLTRMYGPAGRLTLAARPGGGVLATVSLPFRTEVHRG